MLEDYKEKQPILYKMIVNSVNKNKISHAYLIETNYNPAGFNFAVSFAKFLLCPYHKSKIEKCNSCTQCQRIDDNCFSELKVLKTDTLQIKKEQISDLQKEFSLKSVESSNKVYIIEEAEKLNDSSSATLLKFLEEPEANIIAILITPSKDLLLNTILSRCQILKMHQVKQINNSPEKELLDMLSIENQDEFIKDETNIEKFNSIKKFIKEKQRIKYLVISALITLLITAFFIFPMLEQMISGKFLFNNTDKISEITKRSVPIYALFLEIILPLKYWIPAGIGIIFIYLTYLKIKSRNIKDSFITQCFIIGVLCLFLASNIFPWKLFEKAFSLIQFPWRLYVITTVLLTVGGGILISKIYTKNKDRIKQLIIVFSLSLISLISITVTTLLSGNTNLNNYYISMGEYLPSDVNLDYIKERGNVVTSNNQITFTHKKVDNKIIIDFVNNYDNTILELPLLYYKGYGAKINNEYLDVFKTDNGLVGVKLNNIKEGTLEVSYIKTPTIYISRGISLLSVTIFGLYLYMKGRKKDEKQKNI